MLQSKHYAHLPRSCSVHNWSHFVRGLNLSELEKCTPICMNAIGFAFVSSRYLADVLAISVLIFCQFNHWSNCTHSRNLLWKYFGRFATECVSVDFPNRLFNYIKAKELFCYDQIKVCRIQNLRQRYNLIKTWRYSTFYPTFHKIFYWTFSQIFHNILQFKKQFNYRLTQDLIQHFTQNCTQHIT